MSVVSHRSWCVWLRVAEAGLAMLHVRGFTAQLVCLAEGYGGWPCHASCPWFHRTADVSGWGLRRLAVPCFMSMVSHTADVSGRGLWRLAAKISCSWFHTQLVCVGEGYRGWPCLASCLISHTAGVSGRGLRRLAVPYFMSMVSQHSWHVWPRVTEAGRAMLHVHGFTAQLMCLAEGYGGRPCHAWCPWFDGTAGVSGRGLRKLAVPYFMSVVSQHSWCVCLRVTEAGRAILGPAAFLEDCSAGRWEWNEHHKSFTP